MLALTSTPLKEVIYKPRDQNCSLDKLFPLYQYSYIHKINFTKTTTLQVDQLNVDIAHDITYMNLSSVDIGRKNLKKLCQSVAKHGVLENLNLANNNIKDHQAKHIAKMLDETKSLVCLNISYNRLTSDGSEKILKSIKNKALFQNLDMSANVIGLKGFKLLKEILQHSAHLQGFSYNHSYYCNRSNLDNKEIKLLASGLAQNKSLQKLHFCQHHITVDSRNCLLQALTANTSIKTLFLMDLSIDDANMLDLHALVERNTVLKNLYISSCWAGLNCENYDKIYRILCTRQDLHMQY